MASLIICKTKIPTQAASGTLIPLNLLPLQHWQFLSVQHQGSKHGVHVKLPKDVKKNRCKEVAGSGCFCQYFLSEPQWMQGGIFFMVFPWWVEISWFQPIFPAVSARKGRHTSWS